MTTKSAPPTQPDISDGGVSEPDYEAFAKDAMRSWPDADLDANDLEQFAINHGLLIEVEGGFDPAKHECPFGLSEKGDQWFQLAWTLQAQPKGE